MSFSVPGTFIAALSSFKSRRETLCSASLFSTIPRSNARKLRNVSTGKPLRSAGENPLAAETAGLSVVRIRYAGVMTSGALAALGGAFLSIGFNHSFTQNMTAGRGFIALAAVIFGNWRPFGAFAAALLFGGSTALSFRLAQPWGNASVLFQALPYVLTLIAVAGVIGRSVPPAAAGRPYVKQ